MSADAEMRDPAVRNVDDTSVYSKPIRVLHVLNGGFWSGIEAHVLTLARGFNKYHQIGKPEVAISIATLNQGEFADALRDMGFSFRPLNKKFKGDPLVFFKIRKIIQNDDIDIVHTHGFSGNFYGRLGAKMKSNVKIVSTVHDFPEALSYIYKRPLFAQMIERIEKWGSVFSDRHIAVTIKLRERLIEDGLQRDKVSAIPNSLDLDRYPIAGQNCEEAKSALGLDPHEPVVGTAGRLHKRKNVQMFLQAAKQLLDEGVRARFLIVGDGPMRFELEKLTSELGIAEHVHYTGWRTDLISVMRAMDVFVLCSYAEAWPIVILEALALQKPIVSTAVGGIPEIIENGQNGILVPSGDLGRLKNALQDLLREPGKAQQIGHAGRKSIAQKYSDKVMVEKTYQVYHELMLSN